MNEKRKTNPLAGIIGVTVVLFLALGLSFRTKPVPITFKQQCSHIAAPDGKVFPGGYREDVDSHYLPIGPETLKAFDSLRLNISKQEIAKTFGRPYVDFMNMGENVLRYPLQDGWIIVSLKQDKVDNFNALGIPVQHSEEFPTLPLQIDWEAKQRDR